MNNNRGNIIIIEGPQGVGKSTMANFLRDNLASSNLYRLTGIKDKSQTGYAKNKKMYLNLLNYMETLEETELNLIFDRTFFTEQVYASLGFKDYKFDDVYKRLVRQHHQYQAFSLESSIKQQNAYLKLADDLNMPNIKVLKIATDNYEEAYNKLINSIPVLNGIKYTQEAKWKKELN